MSITSDKPKKKQREPIPGFSEHRAVVDKERSISELALICMLESHHTWLESKGKNGEQADLEGVRFGSAELRGANLKGAKLTNADFGEKADLRHADLRGCNLTDVTFGQADVEGALFQGACLEGADLQSVRNLVPDQLSATVLSRAALPEEYRTLPGIDQVNKIVSLGRTTFFMMLAASVFTLFVIATTEDVELISGSSARTLPLVDFEIPVVGFVHLAPAIVLALYLYLTLYLVALLEELSTLPAIFPDNRRLDQHVDPWIMTSLICRFMPRLDLLRPSFSKLREIGAIAIAWWVAPIVLGVVWLYYIRAHMFWSSLLHAMFFVVAIVLGMETYCFCRSKLKTGIYPTPFQLSSDYQLKPRRFVLKAVLGIVIAGVFSSVAITQPRPQLKNTPASWVANEGSIQRSLDPADTNADVTDPLDTGFEMLANTSVNGFKYLLLFLDQQRFLDISNTSVSTRPTNWTDPLDVDQVENEQAEADIDISSDQTTAEATDFVFYSDFKRSQYVKNTKRILQDSGVRFADLSQRDLRGVIAVGSFFATSKLVGAEIDGADLTSADLRAADLTGTRGINTLFSEATLNGADFSGAILESANFENASMKGVKMWRTSFLSTTENGTTLMTGADLTGADLSEASLRGVTLHRAILLNANMPEVDMQDANLVGALLKGAYMGSANLSGAVMSGADLSRTDLKFANLSNANLSGANLNNAELIGTDLTGATLSRVNLTGAILSSANLSGTDLTQIQLNLACGDEQTRLPEGLVINPCISIANHGAKQ